MLIETFNDEFLTNPSCMKIGINFLERISTLFFHATYLHFFLFLSIIFFTETFNKEASFFRGVHIRRPHFNHSHFSTVSTVYSWLILAVFYPLLTLNLILKSKKSHTQTLEVIYEYPYLFAPEYILHI